MGRPVKFTQISWEEFGKILPPLLVEVFKFYENSGHAVDVPALREQYPDLYTMERYLRENGWENWTEKAVNP